MTHLAPFLVITLLILALVVYWVRRSSNHVVTIDDFSDAQKALESVLTRFHAVERMLDPNDLEFVSRQSRPEIQRLFQQERKAVAISWLWHARKQVARLMDLHLKLASCSYEPVPTFEFKLALNYLFFIAACHLLLILFWLRGPFRVRNIVGYTIGAVERFCVVFARRHDSINPARLSPVRTKFR